MDYWSDLHLGQAALLIAALAIAFGFECVNGFHDTANAVATVIYTRTLRPWTAVIWSGFWNFIGVMVGGIGVAFSIVHLLPVDLLVHVNTAAGLGMVLSLLGAAILWNAGTWFLGLPASSSHALIGAILGTGLMNSVLERKAFGEGVNWHKAGEVGLSLLISPLIGFGLAAALLLLLKRMVPRPELYHAPEGDDHPPGWIRAVLVFTCTGVSFAHGSNDGQKGMGLIMLILIGIIPAQFALNMRLSEGDVRQTLDAARQLDGTFATDFGLPSEGRLRLPLGQIITTLDGKESFHELEPDSRWALRTAILEFQSAFAEAEGGLLGKMSADRQRILQSLSSDLNESIEYVPDWVVLGVALALGLGTMVGWKRIVVTVGEKIGKTHLNYGQGASAEFVAMATIGLADFSGMPVSTTHVLSSGVAGTMWANRSGIQRETVRNLLLAWVLTLPVTMVLAATFFGLTHMLFGR